LIGNTFIRNKNAKYIQVNLIISYREELEIRHFTFSHYMKLKA